jgi:hypothetical protein
MAIVDEYGRLWDCSGKLDSSPYAYDYEIRVSGLTRLRLAEAEWTDSQRAFKNVPKKFEAAIAELLRDPDYNLFSANLVVDFLMQQTTYAKSTVVRHIQALETSGDLLLGFRNSKTNL